MGPWGIRGDIDEPEASGGAGGARWLSEGNLEGERLSKLGIGAVGIDIAGGTL